MPDHSPLEKAFHAFDAANAQDPNSIDSTPKELLFAQRLTEAVLHLNPDASEALRLASRCQHICRWQVPRNTEPMGRAGYLKWRAGLKKYHATLSGEILRNVGYDEQTIQHVHNLNLKKNLKTDPDCQTLEDALCLVFLRHQLDALIDSTEEQKMIRIIQKTWSKMSQQGRLASGNIPYSPEAAAILSTALSPEN